MVNSGNDIPVTHEHLSSGKSAIEKIRIAAKNIALSTAKFILPPTCMACERPTAAPGLVCGNCWSEIRFIEKPYCEVLGVPFAYELGQGALSAQAIASPPAFDRARAVAHYDQTARQLVQGLKFSDRTDLVPWMAKWMVRAGMELLQENPKIVPVPLHYRRLLSRRFNQSAELARALAKNRKLQYLPQVLVRVRATKQQVGLGAKERHRNVQGAFKVPPAHKIDVAGRNILLIDDVYTTGATLEACARALKRAGAKKVDCLTFAQVGSTGLR